MGTHTSIQYRFIAEGGTKKPSLPSLLLMPRVGGIRVLLKKPFSPRASRSMSVKVVVVVLVVVVLVTHYKFELNRAIR